VSDQRTTRVVNKTVKLSETRDQVFISLPVEVVRSLRSRGVKLLSVVVGEGDVVTIEPVNPPINHNPYKFPS